MPTRPMSVIFCSNSVYSLVVFALISGFWDTSSTYANAITRHPLLPKALTSSLMSCVTLPLRSFDLSRGTNNSRRTPLQDGFWCTFDQQPLLVTPSCDKD